MRLRSTYLICILLFAQSIIVISQNQIQLGINVVSKYLLTHYSAYRDDGLFIASDQKSENTIGYIVVNPEINLTILIKQNIFLQIAYQYMAFKPKIEINSLAFTLKERKNINPFESSINIQSNTFFIRVKMNKEINRKFDLEYGIGVGINNAFTSFPLALDSANVTRKLSNPTYFILKFYDLQVPSLSYRIQSVIGISFRVSYKVSIHSTISHDLGLNQYYFLKGNYRYFQDSRSQSDKPITTFMSSRNDGLSLSIGLNYML